MFSQRRQLISFVSSLPRSRHLATQVANPSTLLSESRKTWTKDEIQAVFDTPLLELAFRSAAVHRMHHDPRKIQLCTLMNIKSARL